MAGVDRARLGKRDPRRDVTKATIDLAKDNVQFGVRAVDQDGHHSPVAAPVPVA